MTPTFLAGAAEAIITPPVGTLLDGYGGRVGGSVGVHDDLHARAVVVDDGTTQAAIVSCELIGVDRRLVAAARERACAATGIPAAHIMIAATHTHAGPAGLRRDLDEALTDVTARTIGGAIEAAHRAKRPAVLKAGRGSVDSVSQNRRDPDGPYDEALRVLLFDAPDPRDGAIAAIVNFACHATVLFSTNMQISADYAGLCGPHGAGDHWRCAGALPQRRLRRCQSRMDRAAPRRSGARRLDRRRGSRAASAGVAAAGRAAEGMEHPLGRAHRQARDVGRSDRRAVDSRRPAQRRRAAAALEPPDVYDRRIADLQQQLGQPAATGLAHEGERPAADAADAPATVVRDGA